MITPTAAITNPTTARITGWAAILAPILLLASTVAYITEGNGINDGSAGGTIGVWSVLAFLLAFIGIYRALEPAAPRAAPILLSITALGSAAGVGFNIGAILAAEFGRDAVDTATEETPFTLLAYLPWGWFFPIGVLAAGILMWRTRTFTKLSAGLLIASGVLFVVSRAGRIDVLAVVADCVAIAALVPIGWTLLTQSRTSTPSAHAGI